MIGHPESKKIPPLLAPETMEHLPGGTDREGRSLFRVKGAKPEVALAGPLELDKLADELNDVHGSLDFFFGRLVKVHRVIPGLKTSPCPEKEKTPSLDEGVVRLSLWISSSRFDQLKCAF
jgi:hypothetical protein